MAIKFQYNKTSLGELGKQLKMRQKALPTIKSKESALRSEVKKAKDSAQDYRRRLDALKGEYDYMVSLWGEFDSGLLRIADVELSTQKIAGVRTPVLQDVRFEEKPYDLFSSPVWFADGVDVLKRLARLGLEYEVYNRRMELLDRARRKTTQKVNLYERCRYPGTRTPYARSSASWRMRRTSRSPRRRSSRTSSSTPGRARCYDSENVEIRLCALCGAERRFHRPAA